MRMLFIEKFGEPAPDQTWGFGSPASGTTRSAANPEVLSINAPYTEAWVTEYLATAKEPNSTNVADNYDNSTKWWVEGTPGTPGTPAALTFDPNKNTIVQTLTYNFQNGNAAGNGYSSNENKAFWTEWCQPYNDGNYSRYGVSTKEDAVPVIKKKLDDTNRSDWYSYTPSTEGTPGTEGHYEEYKDETFVRNFKITGTWNGNIGVLGSEGENAARTVVVTGKWNMAGEYQSVGGNARIIVANGGEVNIPAGNKLNSNNAAQLVVLPGGKITGEGAIALNNGTRSDMPSYNGGTIDVAEFNNNGGDFFNYGTLKADVMEGGAGNSHYYNHNVISINKCESSNVRLFNKCQFYCAGDMRIRNYEGVNGSSLICGGQLMCSSSMDGTNDASYVTLGNGALVQCGTLYNNGSSWSGPTEAGEWAVLDITEKIVYLNWEQDAPQNGGYFANNLYVSAGTWENTDVDGNGMQGWTAGRKFETIRNAAGNGNVTIIQKTTDPNDNIIPDDEGFEAGVKGCTPGFNGKPIPIRIIAEDLSASEGSDFDFNDVVFDVIMNYPKKGEHTITLLAAGGTLPLTVGGEEVHAKFGVETGKMVNTAGWTAKIDPVTFIVSGNYSNAKEIEIRVKKGNDWPLLTAEQGKAASKIVVPNTYKWCEELKDIEDVYPDFNDYVDNPQLKWWETPAENAAVYNK